MFARRKIISDSEKGSPPPVGRLRLVMYGVFYSVSVVAGVGYHFFQWNTGTAGPVTIQLAYQIVLLLGYVSLWIILHHLFRVNRSSPARAMWRIFVGGITYLAIGAIVSRIGGIPAVQPGGGLTGFDLQTGTPIVLVSIFKMNLLATGQLVFAFLLLLKLQDLVLVKRSRSSQRNWFVMLGMMVITSLTALLNAPGETLTTIQTVLMIASIVFMIVNSFRLTWIVFLSFREKLATIALTLVVGLTLFLGIGIMNEGPVISGIVPGAYSFLEHYSYPLAVFVGQASIFGILYCTTAFLSVLFHLPTSGEYEQRAGERAAMHSLTDLVSQVFDSENLFSTIAAAPVEAGSASVAWLAVPDYQSDTLRPVVVSSHNIKIEDITTRIDCRALYEEASNSRSAVHLEHAPADHRVDAKPGDGVGSLLIIPLVAREEVLGVLFAAKEVVRGFERDDIETIGIFAAQAAVAIDNARLFEQQVEKERLSRELSIAREVQQKLLPHKIPEIEGLSIHASSVSALEVGGDYYDFVRLVGNRLGVIIGDVSGKGTSAAFYMAEMQGIFQSVSRLVSSPHAFLNLANAALASSLDKNVFISAVYGIFDLETEQFVAARAGHCPAALVRMDGESRFVRTAGMGLGLDRGELFGKSLTEENLSLCPGDVFAFYTDGVVESRNVEGEEYGYDRLMECLESCRHEDAKSIHDLVLENLQSFIGETLYDDDMTLVIIKWHGLPSAHSVALEFETEEASSA